MSLAVFLWHQSGVRRFLACNSWLHRCNGQFFPQSVFSPRERFEKSVFSPPSQFFPPMLFFRKRLENNICVIVRLNQIKYHSEIAVL